MDNEIILRARELNREMEDDGTWATLRRQVLEQRPDGRHERRFILFAGSEESVAPALWLRKEPWTEEAADNWMEYLWESQRVGGFKVDVTSLSQGDGHSRATLQITADPESERPMGVSLTAICDLATSTLFRGKAERVPSEAAYLAFQCYTREMLPADAVQWGEPENVTDDGEGVAQPEQTDGAPEWVKENWESVSAMAWAYYLKLGRGAVVPNGAELNYVTESHFRETMNESVAQGGDRDAAEQVLGVFSQYDPARQVLALTPTDEWSRAVDLGEDMAALFPRQSGASLALALVTNVPAPPDAYASVFVPEE